MLGPAVLRGTVSGPLLSPLLPTALAIDWRPCGRIGRKGYHGRCPSFAASLRRSACTSQGGGHGGAAVTVSLRPFKAHSLLVLFALDRESRRSARARGWSPFFCAGITSRWTNAYDCALSLRRRATLSATTCDRMRPVTTSSTLLQPPAPSPECPSPSSASIVAKISGRALSPESRTVVSS